MKHYLNYTISKLTISSSCTVWVAVPVHFRITLSVFVLCCHMVHLLKVPPEITGNDVIVGYFQIGRPGATQQTPGRDSGQMGGLIWACIHWSFARWVEHPTAACYVVLLMPFLSLINFVPLPWGGHPRQKLSCWIQSAWTNTIISPCGSLQWIGMPVDYFEQCEWGSMFGCTPMCVSLKVCSTISQTLCTGSG